MNTATRCEIKRLTKRQQHNAALRRRNHTKKNEKLDMCENHLFKLKKKREKDAEGVILGQNNLKSLLLDERRRYKV